MATIDKKPVRQPRRGGSRPSSGRPTHRLPPQPQWEKGTEPESEATEAEPDVIAENEARAAQQDYHYEDAFYDDED